MTFIDRDRNLKHPEGLTDPQEQLALEIFNVRVIKFGEYRLKLHEENPEAPLSPVYFDIRVVTLHPEVLRSVANVYRGLSLEVEGFDAVLGIPDAGIPLPTAFSLITETPQIVLRKEAKRGHGIEGQFLTQYDPETYKRVLVLDDLMTTAKSKIETLDILEGADLIVTDVCVLLDRDQNGLGKQQLKARGVDFHSAYTLEALLNFYARVGKITHKQHEDIKSRLADLSKFIKGKSS